MSRVALAAVAIVFLAIASKAQAAEDPTGTWKWTSSFGNTTIESTAKLKLEGDKVTGTYTGRNNTESPITNGTFKDNTVKFDVVREFNGNKFTIKYSGAVSGDAIKGKISIDREGQAQEIDWDAKRQK